MDAGIHHAAWRPVAAWAVLAAGLSLGLGSSVSLSGNAVVGALGSWPTLLLCTLLADGLWGGIWRGMTGLSTSAKAEAQTNAPQVWLPYLQPGSPAARLLGRGNPGEIDHNLRATLPMLLAAGLLASVLGPAALILTGGFVLVAGFAWVGQRSRQIPAGLLHSLATILLPWGLVLLLMSDGGNARSWLLALLWTLHSWGAGQLATNPSKRGVLLWMAGANAGMAILLIVAQAPLWVAVLAALWLPAWLTLIQGGSPRRVDLLWTLSMLISAGALATGF